MELVIIQIVLIRENLILNNRLSAQGSFKPPILLEKVLTSAQVPINAQLKLSANLNKVFYTFNERPGPIKRPVRTSALPKTFILNKRPGGMLVIYGIQTTEK